MKLFITSVSLLLFTFTATAQQNEVYEYLTMIKMNHELHISIGSNGYEKFNIKNETDDKMYDLNAVNKRISSFEADGWEYVSAEHSVMGVNSIAFISYKVVMRRPKK